MPIGDKLVQQALKEATKAKPNYGKAFALLENAAAKDNAEALYAIGTIIMELDRA